MLRTNRSRRFFPLVLLPFLAAFARGGDTGVGLAITPASREQARVLYNTVYQASEGVPSGWTGDVSQGIAGTTSQAFKDAINLRINYFRAMAGVPAVITFSDAFNDADQQAALMTSANQTLDHAPPMTWLDYTSAGAEATAAGNIALGPACDGPPVVTGYMADDGDGNESVGHRRWLLFPPETTMGTGDVDNSSDHTFLAANCLWVMDLASFASPAPAPRDGLVAWPPAGYVPYPLVFARWSLSYPGADFNAATVTTTTQGVTTPAPLETSEDGYGDNTLVWVPDLPQSLDAPPVTEQPIIVSVSNVLINGAAQSFTYTVIPFDPSVTGPDTVTPVLGGPTQPAVGLANAYTFNAVPNATGYRWQASTMSPFSLDLDAENGPGDVTITPAGTNLITTAQAANGSASYQFASNPPEAMTINAAFLPAAGCTLAFNAQLDYASPAETAHVQISTDAGTSWTDLYTDTGTGGQTENAFQPHAIDLSAYAGQSCLVRFAYTYSGSGEYYPLAGQTGWFVDDITITGAQTVAVSATADLPADQTGFTFTPAAAGSYVLQVTPIFYGQYPTDAGPVWSVNASGDGPAVTVTATAPLASISGGTDGAFTLTRAAGADLSAKLKVNYELRGAAVNGVDYAALSGKVRIKPGQASATVTVVPEGTLGGMGARKVKLVLLAGDGYSVGTPAMAKVKIMP